MAFENKSQKAFIAVTLVTVLAIVSVITVYAVLIAQFTGGEVTVLGMGDSTIVYNLNDFDNDTGWGTILTAENVSSSWYSRLEINEGDYSGYVTIDWQLQRKIDAVNWQDVTGANRLTSLTLSGVPQDVYATTNGTFAEGNYDWGLGVVTAGTYRIVVDVNSA